MKTIQLIELFAGVGSQAMALRDLGLPFKHLAAIEFDKYAMGWQGDNRMVVVDIEEVESDTDRADESRCEMRQSASIPCI